MPHLHRRIPAMWAEVEEEMSVENKLKTVQWESEGGGAVEEEAEKSSSMLGREGGRIGG